MAAVTLVTPAWIVNIVKIVKAENKYIAQFPIFLYPSNTVSFFTTVYLVENSKKGYLRKFANSTTIIIKYPKFAPALVD